MTKRRKRARRNPSMTLRELQAHFKLMSSGDAWGDVMNARFEIADALLLAGNGVPERWEYRPGLFGPDVSENDYYRMLNAGEVDAATLEKFGDALQRASDLLREQGRDY